MHLFWHLVTGFLATANQVTAKPYVIDTAKNISYQGVTSSPGIETFLGISFGKDTGGAGRFAPPQPFNPSSGYLFNATSEGPSCPQSSGGGFLYETNVTYISEDCLNLLLSRPAGIGDGEKIPVMVYIYGGIMMLLTPFNWLK